MIDATGNSTLEVYAAVEALLLGEQSVLQQALNMSQDLSNFLVQLQAFRDVVLGMDAVFNGPAVNVSQDLRTAVEVAAPTINRIVPALDSLSKAASAAAERRAPTVDFSSQPAAFATAMGSVDPADVAVYASFHEEVAEQLGRIQTVVETIQAQDSPSGIDLDSMRITLTSLMRSHVPSAKQTVLSEARSDIVRVQAALGAKLDAALASLDSVAAAAEADTIAVAAASASSPLVDTSRTAGSVAVASSGTVPAAVVGLQAEAAVTAQLTTLMSSVGEVVTDFAASLTQLGSVLQHARGVVKQSLADEFDRHASLTMSQGLTGLAQVVSSEMDAAAQDAQESLILRLSNLAAEWQSSESFSSVMDLMSPNAAPFDGVRASVYQEALEQGVNKLEGHTHAFAEAASPFLVAFLNSTLRPILPVVDAQLEEKFRQTLRSYRIGLMGYMMPVPDWVFGRNWDENKRLWVNLCEIVTDYGIPAARSERLAELDQSFNLLTRDFGSGGIASVAGAMRSALQKIDDETATAGGVMEPQVADARARIEQFVTPLESVQRIAIDAGGITSWATAMLDPLQLTGDELITAAASVESQLHTLYAVNDAVVDRYIPNGLQGVRSRVPTAVVEAQLAALRVYAALTNVTAHFVNVTEEIDLDELNVEISRCMDRNNKCAVRYPSNIKPERYSVTPQQLYRKFVPSQWSSKRVFRKHIDRTAAVSLVHLGRKAFDWGSSIMLDFRAVLHSTDEELALFLLNMEQERGVLTALIDRTMPRCDEGVPAVAEVLRAATHIRDSIHRVGSLAPFNARTLLAAALAADLRKSSHQVLALRGQCNSFYRALDRVMWPSILAAERRFRQAYAPLARMNYAHAMYALREKESTTASFDDLLDSVLEVSAEQTLIAPWHRFWEERGPDNDPEFWCEASRLRLRIHNQVTKMMLKFNERTLEEDARSPMLAYHFHHMLSSPGFASLMKEGRLEARFVDEGPEECDYSSLDKRYSYSRSDPLHIPPTIDELADQNFIEQNGIRCQKVPFVVKKAALSCERTERTFMLNGRTVSKETVGCDQGAYNPEYCYDETCTARTYEQRIEETICGRYQEFDQMVGELGADAQLGWDLVKYADIQVMDPGHRPASYPFTAMYASAIRVKQVRMMHKLIQEAIAPVPSKLPILFLPNIHALATEMVSAVELQGLRVLSAWSRDTSGVLHRFDVDVVEVLTDVQCLSDVGQLLDKFDMTSTRCPFGYHLSLDARTGWLSTFLSLAECAATEAGLVVPSNVIVGSTVVAEMMRVWDGLRWIDATNARLVSEVTRPLQAGLDAVVASAFASLTTTDWAQISAVLQDVLTLSVTLNDDIRRATCSCGQEAHVIVAAAHAVSGARTTLSVINTADALSSANSTTVVMAALSQVFTGLTGFIEAATTAAGSTGGAVSDRDATSVASFTSVGQLLLDNFVAAIAPIPFVLYPDSQLAACAQQLHRSVVAAEFTVAMDGIVSLAHQASALGVHSSTAELVGAAEVMGHALEFGLQLTEWGVIFDLHREATLTPGAADVAAAVSTFFSDLSVAEPGSMVFTPPQGLHEVSYAASPLIQSGSRSAELASRRTISVTGFNGFMQRMLGYIVDVDVFTTAHGFHADIKTELSAAAANALQVAARPYGVDAATAAGDIQAHLTSAFQLLDEYTRTPRAATANNLHMLSNLSNHHAMRCTMLRSQGSSCSTPPAGTDACEAAYLADGSAEEHCCAELFNAGHSPAACMSDAACVTAAAVAGTMPDDCCPAVWAAGLSHASCPLLNDCNVIVASHDPISYLSVVPPQLPARCCYDSRVSNVTELHPACQSLSTSKEQQCPVCALTRLAWHMPTEWGINPVGPRRLNHATGFPSLQANLDAAMAAAASASATLSTATSSGGDVMQATEGLAVACASAVGVFARFSGPVAHHACLVESGYSTWAHAVSMLTSDHLVSIARLATKYGVTEADAVGALWADFASLSASERQAGILGVVIAFRVALSTFNGNGIPEEYHALVSPQHAVPNHEFCSTQCAGLQPNSALQACPASDRIQAMRATLEVAAPGATSFVSRRLAANAQFSSELASFAAGMADSIAVVATGPFASPEVSITSVTAPVVSAGLGIARLTSGAPLAPAVDYGIDILVADIRNLVRVLEQAEVGLRTVDTSVGGVLVPLLDIQELLQLLTPSHPLGDALSIAELGIPRSMRLNTQAQRAFISLNAVPLSSRTIADLVMDVSFTDLVHIVEQIVSVLRLNLLVGIHAEAERLVSVDAALTTHYDLVDTFIAATGQPSATNAAAWTTFVDTTASASASALASSVMSTLTPDGSGAVRWLHSAARAVEDAIRNFDEAASRCSIGEQCPSLEMRMRASYVSLTAQQLHVALNNALSVGDPSFAAVQLASSSLYAVLRTFETLADQDVLRALRVADTISNAVDEFMDAANAFGWSFGSTWGLNTLTDLHDVYQLGGGTLPALFAQNFDPPACTAAKRVSRWADEARVSRHFDFVDVLTQSQASSAVDLGHLVPQLSLDSAVPILQHLFVTAESARVGMAALGEPTVSSIELQLRTLQAHTGQLCRQLEAKVIVEADTAPLTAAVDAVAAQPTESLLVSQAIANLPTRVAEAWIAGIDPMADVWAHLGHTSLAAASTSALHLAESLLEAPFRSSPECNAAGVEAGTCPGTTSFAVPGSADVLRLAAIELSLVIEELEGTIPMHGVPGAAGADLLPLDTEVSMSRLASAVASTRYALDLLYARHSVDEVAQLLPDASGLLVALQLLGVSSSVGAMQPLMWTAGSAPAFFQRVQDSVAAVDDVVVAVTAGVATLAPLDLQQLVATVSAAISSLQGAVGSDSAPPALMFACLRAEMGVALDDDAHGDTSVSAAARATILQVDSIASRLVVPGMIARLPTADLLTLYSSMTAMLADIRSHAGLRPQFEAITAAVHQGVALMRTVSKLTAVTRSLAAVDDAAAFSLIGYPSSANGVLNHFAEVAFSRLVEQTKPMVASLSVGVGSAAGTIDQLATAAAADLAGFAPTVPLLSLGSFTGPTPWLQLQLDNLKVLVPQVQALTAALRAKLTQAAIDLGVDTAVVSEGQLAFLMQASQDAAVHLTVVLKQTVAAAADVSTFSTLPPSVTELLDFVQVAFGVRCVTSCAFDASVNGAVHAAHAASQFVYKVSEFESSDNLNLLLLSAGPELVRMSDSLAVATGGHVGTLSPLPLSVAGAELVASAASVIDGAIAAGHISTSGTEGVDLVTSMHDFAAELANANTFTSTESIFAREQVQTHVMTRLKEATATGFDIPVAVAEATARGDLDLVAALGVLERYVPLSSQRDSALAAAERGVRVTESWRTLLQFVSTINELEDLDASNIGTEGFALGTSALALGLPLPSQQMFAELGAVDPTTVTSTATAFTLAVGAAGGPSAFTGSVQSAVTDAVSASVAVSSSLANAAAVGVAVPMPAPSAFATNTAAAYGELRSALSSWRAATTDIVRLMSTQLGPGTTLADISAASPVGAAAVAAIEAVRSVDEQRFDGGQLDVVGYTVLLQRLLGDVRDVATLIASGADKHVVRREAGDVAAELAQRLEEAVLRQVDGVVSPFVSFVANAQSIFGVSGTGPDPAATGAVARALLEPLEAALSYTSDTSTSLLGLATEFDSLATTLHEFPLGVDDDVLAALDNVRTSLEVVREVSDSVDSLVDASTTFTSYAFSMSNRLPEYVELVNSLVDRQLNHIMDLFDELLGRVEEVEERAGPANRGGVARAQDLVGRIRSAFADLTPFSALDELSTSIALYKRLLLDLPGQDIDSWEDVIALAQEISAAVGPYDTFNELKMGELGFAMTSALVGLELVERRTARLQALVAVVDNIFTQLADFDNLSAAFISALPDEPRVAAAFKALKDSNQHITEVFSALSTGVSDQLLAMGYLVDEALEVVTSGFDEQIRQQLLLRTQADRVSASAHGVDVVVGRRYRISDVAHLFRNGVNVPVAAAAVLRRFTDRFLGGLDREFEFIDPTSFVTDLPASCASNFAEYVPFDAVAALREASDAMPQYRSNFDTMASIAAELPQLASVSRTQKCVEGSTCSLSLISTRLSEAALLLRSMKSSIAAFTEVAGRTADITQAFVDVGTCHAVLPGTIDFWVDTTQSLMSGELVSLSTSSLSEAVESGLAITGDVSVMTTRLDTALASLRTQATASVSAASAATKATTIAEQTITEATAWLSSIVPVLNELSETQAVVYLHQRFLSEATTLEENVRPLFDAAENFVRLPTVRFGGYWEDFRDTVATARADMLNSQIVLRRKQSSLMTLLAIMRTMQDEITEIPVKPASALVYCDESICMQHHNRSTETYRNIVFPGLTTRFWYETIPYGNRHRMVRCVWMVLHVLLLCG